MEVNPLNIFFVKSDSKGDRLLFRYPYTTEEKDEGKQRDCGRDNPYAINNITEDLLQNHQPQNSNICKGQLSGFTDEMLSTLFAVKAELCNRKFELKVNDVRFVGHPTLLPYRTNKEDTAAMILINIVFALQASASHSIVKCYYDLSKRLGKALRHEEKRCSYLTEEMKIMLSAHDEASSLDACDGADADESRPPPYCAPPPPPPPRCAFDAILRSSSLARSMRSVFEELSSTGIVHVTINKWVLLSFCLPHKAHQIHNKGMSIEPETIDKCLEKLRPYHGILLMVDPNELLQSIPLDGSPALLRLIKLYSPLKSLQTLAIEADLSLEEVFQLTGHLVYWAKATVIYPLCEGNVYVVAPGCRIHAHSPLVDEFAAEFPGLCLLQLVAAFSWPAPLWYHARGAAASRLARAVAWLLRRRVLLQLHTYVQFRTALARDGKEYYCEKHDTLYNQAHVSAPHAPQLNVPEPLEPRHASNMFPDSDEDYPTQNNLNQTDFSHTKPIVIESELPRKSEQADSANHSFEDGVDTVDGLSKAKADSVDSGIANNLTADSEESKERLGKRLSDISLREDGSLRDLSSDDDRFGSDPDLPRAAAARGDHTDGVSLTLRLQHEMSFQQPTVWSDAAGCEAGGGVGGGGGEGREPSEEAALDAFSGGERAALAHGGHSVEDLLLLARLHKKGYFRGSQHLEEIMFMENVSRSQLTQLLDKFRDVLITFETEDPAVAMLYPY